MAADGAYFICQIPSNKWCGRVGYLNTQSDDVRLSDNKDDICIPFSCPTTIMIMNNNSINCERKEPEIKTRIVWHMKNERAGGKGKGKKTKR